MITVESQVPVHSPRSRLPGRTVVLGLLAAVAIGIGILMSLRIFIQRPPTYLPPIGTVVDVAVGTSTGAHLQTGSLGHITLFDLQPRNCGPQCEERDFHMGQIEYWNRKVADHIQQATILEGPGPWEPVLEKARKLEAPPTWHFWMAEPTAYAALEQNLLPDRSVADLVLVDWEGKIRRRYLLANKEHRRELLLDSRALVLEHERALAGAGQREGG